MDIDESKPINHILAFDEDEPISSGSRAFGQYMQVPAYAISSTRSIFIASLLHKTAIEQQDGVVGDIVATTIRI